MKKEKYYGYLYEIIIPTSDGEKHYYGKKEYDHRRKQCTGIYESYWGSGIIIKDWFLKHTNNNYTSRCCPKKIAVKLGVKRIIHGFYKTREELCIAEKILVNNHLGKAYCINLAAGGTGGNVGHYVCTEITREKKRANHLGTRMWTNGIINKKSKNCPGKEWFLGLTLSKKEITRRKNYTPVNIKPIKCIELQIIFKSITDVFKYFNCKNNYYFIEKACKDKNETWNGYHWEFIKD